MTVEVTLTDSKNWTYGNYDERMFETAQYFSGSTNFTIVDSYSSISSPTRYNGDPIANGSWATSGDVSEENSWFVIECTTTLYPALSMPNWQAKFQWCNTAGFDDVSGLDYDLETDIRTIAVRFAPYGGWDLDPTTPDFEGPGGELSGKNKEFDIPGSTNKFVRSIIIEDDGQFMFVRKDALTGSQQTFQAITCILGDFTAIDATEQTMPRLHINAPSADLHGSPGNGSWICEEQYWTSVIGYENPSGVWTEESFKTQTGGTLINAYTQPTQHTPSFEIDVLPYTICTYTSGIIGELPLVGKCYGIGQSLFANRTWCSTSGEYGVCLKWDGTTDLE